MFTNFKFKLVLLSTLLVIPLIFGTPSDVYAQFGGFKEPPGGPGSEALVGKTIVGWISITQGPPKPDGFGGFIPQASILFYSGKCFNAKADDDDAKSRPVQQIDFGLIEGIVVSSDIMTKADLVGTKFQGVALLPQCYGSEPPSGDLVITVVKKFINNGQTLVAKVKIRRVIQL